MKQYRLAFFLIMGAILVALPMHNVLGQKIKYKDLHEFLQANRFDEAAPLLKAFLTQDKNQDHPNGNFYMARIYDQFSRNADIFMEFDKFMTYADSAIIYYDNAARYVDEKEVRKNDDFYIEYTRRDVRTGKVGISLSDVLLDIENRTSAIKDYRSAVLRSKELLDKTVKAHHEVYQNYESLRSQFNTIKNLYFQSEETELQVLQTIAAGFASFEEGFNEYKKSLSKVNGTQYNQKVIPREIEGFPKTEQEIDFLEPVVNLPNYKTWADNATKIIVTDIIPLREPMVAMYEEISKLYEKVADGVVVYDAIDALPYRLLRSQMFKHDSQPLPVLLFDLSIAELKLKSLRLEKQIPADSIDWVEASDIANTNFRMLQRLDSIGALLVSAQIDPDNTNNYKGFISRSFGSKDDFFKHIHDKITWVKADFKLWESKKISMEQRLEWVAHEEKKVPLKKIDFIDLPREGEFFYPLIIDSLYSAGVYFNDENMSYGYLTDINPHRVSKSWWQFELNKELFAKTDIESFKALIRFDENGQGHHAIFYSEKAADQKQLQIQHHGSPNNKPWSTTISIARTPNLLQYDEESKRLQLLQQKGTSKPELLAVFNANGEELDLQEVKSE